MIRINPTNEDNTLERLRRLQIPHRVYCTNRTTVIETSRGPKYLCTQNKLSGKELGFIRRVKSEVSRRAGAPEKWGAEDVSFFRMNREILPGTYCNFLEIDVNSAYWNLAHKLGFLGDEVYWQGLEVRKPVRLIALGACATTKRIYSYDTKSGRYSFDGSRFDPKTRWVFFRVAAELGDIMEKVILKVGRENFLGYWVDAFLVDSGRKERVKDVIRSLGLSCKVKDLSSITVKNIDGCLYFYAVEVSRKGRGYEENLFAEPDQFSEIKIKYFQVAGANYYEKQVNRIRKLIDRIR